MCCCLEEDCPPSGPGLPPLTTGVGFGTTSLLGSMGRGNSPSGPHGSGSLSGYTIALYLVTLGRREHLKEGSDQLGGDRSRKGLKSLGTKPEGLLHG